MKTFLLLGLLLVGLAPDAATAATHRDGPEHLLRLRRHLRHQTKMRLRQNRRH